MEVSDLWFFATVILAGVFFALYVRLSDATSTQFARAHYSLIKGDSSAQALSELSEDEFVSHYLRVRRWRDPAYLILFLTLSAGVSIFTLMIAQLTRQISDPGPLVWQFLTFFGLIASWVGAVIATLWTYQNRKTAALVFWYNRFNR